MNESNDVWWMMLLRGIALLLLGLLAVVWPGLTFEFLAIFFAVYIIFAGVVDIIQGIGSIRNGRGWFLKVILGFLEIGVSVFILKSPYATLATFTLVVGLVFMIQGIMAIIGAFTDTDDGGMRFLAILAGILGLLAGFVIIRHPVGGGIAFVWVLGLYALIAGPLEIAAALSVKSRNDRRVSRTVAAK